MPHLNPTMGPTPAFSASVVAHEGEFRSNAVRREIASEEPIALRTFTPSQLVIARSAGVWHWTPEGRRLYDFSSGVLVANLGHNPIRWQQRFAQHMGWAAAGSSPNAALGSAASSAEPVDGEYFAAAPMTAYNAITEVEQAACSTLLASLRGTPGGGRMETICWAASGSEAIQKALWAGLAFAEQRDGPARNIIVATRFGFHGKKGLSEAITGSESDKNRDPRVRFVSFPMTESADVSLRNRPFDPAPYAAELDLLAAELGRAGQRIAVVVTEPYLGGGGSYHPPPAYLQLLQDFARRVGAVFVLDEVQSNFGRTGRMYAFDTYGLEPDIVVLGKGLGNGVPVAAAVGRADVFAALKYGEASDTWSANPICCAAVLATLEEFAATGVLAHVRRVSPILEGGLDRLREFPFVRHVRGEAGGMVWGIEFADWAGRTARDLAVECVRAAYLGDRRGRAIHLLGPLAGKVIRVSPPLVITEGQARDASEALRECCASVAARLAGPAVAVPKARAEEPVLLNAGY